MAIIPHIKLINQQLDRYDQEIKNNYDQLPDQDIFDKLPAIGQNIGLPLLSGFAYQTDRFSHFNDIQSLAGSAPVTSKSVKSCHIFFRSACNKIFPNIIDQMLFPV